MLKWLRKKQDPPEIEVDILDDIPRYPPFAEGLPFATPKQLMASQQDLMNTLRATVGVGPEVYDKLYLPIIINYATYAHLLPASEAHHHRGAGGLFRHGLEVAWQASLIFAGRVVHGELTSESRKRIESKLQLAVFIAALCHDAGKCMFDLAVSDRTGDINWDPHETSLMDWLLENNMERYFVHWQGFRKHQTHEHFSSLLIQKIVPKESFSYLRIGTEAITSSLFEMFLTKEHSARYSPLLYDIVSKADNYSVERDLKRDRFSPQDDALGVPIARFVMDAMRRLIQIKQWKINKPGARVWVSEEGTFIVWNAAIDEIFAILDEDNIAGVPHNADKLAKILIERDLAKLSIDGKGKSQLYWRISPQMDKHTASITFNALRISDFSLLSDNPPPALVKLKDLNDEKSNEDNDKDSAEKEDAIKTPPTVTSISAADLIKQSNRSKTNKPKNEDSSKPIEFKNIAEIKEADPEESAAIATPEKNIETTESLDSAEKYPLVDKLLRQANKNNKIHNHNGCIALIFPEDCQPHGYETGDIVEELSLLEVIQPNPDNPMRKVIPTQINKVKTNVIVFTKEITEQYQHYKNVKKTVPNKNKSTPQKPSNKAKPTQAHERSKVNQECESFIAWLQKNDNDSDIQSDHDGITFSTPAVKLRYCKESGTQVKSLSMSIKHHPGYKLVKNNEDDLHVILRSNVNG